uniref:Uncharacterized protein n=1 Tax=Tanacetum cinerariifolium TaxID=118510 RepID=A0A6L2MXY5_TANCI|nr:hypothetical protein [Tanacetum cinerariifolium]
MKEFDGGDISGVRVVSAQKEKYWFGFWVRPIKRWELGLHGYSSSLYQQVACPTPHPPLFGILDLQVHVPIVLLLADAYFMYSRLGLRDLRVDASFTPPTLSSNSSYIWISKIGIKDLSAEVIGLAGLQLYGHEVYLHIDKCRHVNPRFQEVYEKRRLAVVG